jgi:hypothetical protein
MPAYARLDNLTSPFQIVCVHSSVSLLFLSTLCIAIHRESSANPPICDLTRLHVYKSTSDDFSWVGAGCLLLCVSPLDIHYILLMMVMPNPTQVKIQQSNKVI